MIGDDGVLFPTWARGPLRQWLAALGTVAALLLIFWLIFSYA